MAVVYVLLRCFLTGDEDVLSVKHYLNRSSYQYSEMNLLKRLYTIYGINTQCTQCTAPNKTESRNDKITYDSFTDQNFVFLTFLRFLYHLKVEF